MRILLVDDEALARNRLAALIEELEGDYELVGMAANGSEALETFERLGADLVLMDVRMPGMDGLETARWLAQGETPPAVVFTTAYEQHALQAFETQAVDYLLKPVRRERLRQALQKAQRLTLAQLQALQPASEQAAPYVNASYRGGVRRLPLDQAIYLRADSKYVSLRHADGELLLEESLKSLESRFGDWFLRIHRNALVARRHLLGLERQPDGSFQARMAGCEEGLEVSRRHLPELRRWLKTHGR